MVLKSDSDEIGQLATKLQICELISNTRFFTIVSLSFESERR